MTRVDFYVLQKPAQQDRRHFACRLAEKAVAQGSRVMIATGDSAESQAMDELLWSFRPESFVAHTSAADTLEDIERAPVLIGHEGDDLNHHDLLINLRNDIPQNFSRFTRLAELVIQQDTVLEASRKHWAFYKSRGYQLASHKIKG
ncbi:DNA polymerase III, chi subunit [Alteromonadaceae bacterium Bs31]|nr:DNA polymerase III, chi subunit [Alteromonadaceae bacterium Bs31]